MQARMSLVLTITKSTIFVKLWWIMPKMRMSGILLHNLCKLKNVSLTVLL